MKRLLRAFGWFCGALTCAVFASSGSCLAEQVCRTLDDYETSELAEALFDQGIEDLGLDGLFDGDDE